jgi:DNA-binding MarR family transcriptional regulator
MTDTATLCNLLALAAMPTRLRVLRLLASCPADLGTLAGALDVTPGGLVMQLDLLRDARVAELGTTERGHKLYRLTETGRALVDSVGRLDGRLP